ncbi:MAG: CHAT domain-containing tetratricopeptide repeat protein [Candidatus Methanomethylicaceae archaeon]
MKKIKIITIFIVFLPSLCLSFQLDLDKVNEHIRLGKFDTAKIFLTTYLEHQIPPPLKIEILSKLAILDWNLGNLDDYKKTVLEAIKLSKNLNNKYYDMFNVYMKILELYNRGKYLSSQDLFQESISSFREAIQLSQSINSYAHELKCRRVLSINYWKLKDYFNFLNENKIALFLAQKINHLREQSRCLNNMGLAYWKLDNYSEALNCFFLALELSKRTGNLSDQSDILSNIAPIYRDIGNFDLAINYTRLSMKIDEQISNKIGIYLNKINLGTILRQKYLATNDKSYLLEAIKIYLDILNNESILDLNIKVKTYNNIACAYNDLGDYLLSLQYLKKAINIAIEIGDNEEQCIILTNMGIVNFNLGNYSTAIDYYKKAIDLGVNLKNGNSLWETYYELANAYLKRGNYNEAIQHYIYSINIIENIRSKLSLEEDKSNFLSSNKRLDVYHKLISLLINYGNNYKFNNHLKDAFIFNEMAKARSFLDSIEVSKLSLNNESSKILYYQELEIMNEISKLYTKLLTPDLTEVQKQVIYNKLASLEQDLENVRREMRKNNPAYANLQFPQFVTLEEAQKKIIPKKTLVLSYLISTEASYVFAITNKYFKIFPLPKENEIKGLVRNYLMKLTDPDTNNFSEGHELYLVLMDQALRSFNGIKRIIIIPDDLLHYLPFESLLISKNGKYKWLIENYAISYAPSLTSIKEIKERKKTNGDRPKKYLLAIGSPKFDINGKDDNNSQKVILNSFYEPGIDLTLEKLQFSTQEIKSISSYFPIKKSKILIHEDASEEIIKGADLSEYKILHFATHCIIDDKKPARSSIVLRLDQDPQEDGFLQVREIFNLKLNADLVTLSACQTGIGPLIRGEGIDGLNRAFFYAGASSLILSLWPINDQATSQLMQRFYFYVKNHNSIELALQKAKLELINSGTLSHPYYWAAFIPYGDTNIITIKKDIPPIIFASLLLLFIILCFLIRKKIFEFDTTILLTKMVHSWSKGNKDISTISTTESSNYMEFQK